VARAASQIGLAVAENIKLAETYNFMLFRSQVMTAELSLSHSSSAAQGDFASEKEGFSYVINFSFFLALRYTFKDCAHKRVLIQFGGSNLNSN